MPPPSSSQSTVEIRRDLIKLLGSSSEADKLILAAPVQLVHNICIIFHGFAKWFRSFDDNMHDGTLAGKVRRYRFVKEAYQRWVSKIIVRINRSESGRALLAEIYRAKGRKLSIIPQKGEDDASAGAGEPDQATFKGDLVRNSDGSPRSPQQTGTGLGSDSEIEFSPEMWSRLVGSSGRHGPGTNADEVLFHEMVHSARQMNGKSSLFGVNQEYKNEEEFIGLVLSNIYLAEKGQDQLRANWSFTREPLRNPHQFLDNASILPPVRVILERFRVRQMTYFLAVATVPAWFNPVKKYHEELKQKQQAAKRRARP